MVLKMGNLFFFSLDSDEWNVFKTGYEREEKMQAILSFPSY